MERKVGAIEEKNSIIYLNSVLFESQLIAFPRARFAARPLYYSFHDADNCEVQVIAEKLKSGRTMNLVRFL